MTGRGWARGSIRSTVVALGGLALVAGAGCQSKDNSSDDELLALLHDDPLTTVAVGAVTVSDGGVMTGSAGKTGGTAGRGGTGTGGFPGGDGGVSTGTGGIGTMGDGGPGGSVGFDGGGTGGTGGFDGGIPNFSSPLGQWSFDDCNPDRTNLFDSGPNFNTAFRAVSVTCATGISQEAVSLADKDNDIVYVPDQPNFTFGSGRHRRRLVQSRLSEPNPHTVPETRRRKQQRVRAGSQWRQVPVRRQPWEW